MFKGQCTSKVLQSAVSVEVGDGDLCVNKDTRVIDEMEVMEVPENAHGFFPSKGGGINNLTEGGEVVEGE